MERIDPKIALGENFEYADDGTILALSGLPAAAWPVIQAAAKIFGGPKADEEIGVSVFVERSHETLEQWDDSRKGWSECAGWRELVIEGRPARQYERIQMRKGERRHDCLVVDVGDGHTVILTQ